MGVVLFGHGGLDVTPGAIDPDMEWVAVPEGTTLQFYTDAGQMLKVDLDLWPQLKAPWPPIDSSGVTYNLTLQRAPEFDHLVSHPSLAGHTVVRAGCDGLPDRITLCTGNKSTCPTDPRLPAEKKVHKCKGILGLYTGDLYWLACTVVTSAGTTPGAVVAAMGDARTRVTMGQDPDQDTLTMAIPDTDYTVLEAITYYQTDPTRFAAWFDTLTPDGRRVATYHPAISAWNETHPCPTCARDRLACDQSTGHLGAHHHVVSCSWAVQDDASEPDTACAAVCTRHGATCEATQHDDQHWHQREHTW